MAVDVNEDDLREVREAIENEGGEVLTVQADVGDEHDMQRVYKQAMERFERLDIVFANAGINGVWAPIDELEPGGVGPDDSHQFARNLSYGKICRAPLEATQPRAARVDYYYGLRQRHAHL